MQSSGSQDVEHMQSPKTMTDYSFFKTISYHDSDIIASQEC